MDLKKIHFKELAFLLVFLVALKFGINYAYQEGYFDFENIKYAVQTINMEKINTEQFDELIQSAETSTEPALIYMGRMSCPVCVKLMPEIKTILKENEVTANGESVKQVYFDSEKYKSEESKAIRDSIEANYVPSIIVVNGEVTVLESEDIRLENASDVVSSLINK